MDFEIIPIFERNEKICEEFAHVGVCCLLASERNNLFIHKSLSKSYLKEYDYERNVFAFAAYRNKEMIGFTSGCASGKDMFTRSLYVLPEYQGFGIGTKLLTTSERAASLVALNMELFSLESSIGFYKQRGYKKEIVCDRIVETKKLSNVTKGIVPVFEWDEELQLKLNVDVDYNLLENYKCKPMFVYVGKELKIDGVAMLSPDGEQQIYVNNEISKLCKSKLLGALSKVK